MSGPVRTTLAIPLVAAALTLPTQLHAQSNSPNELLATKQHTVSPQSRELQLRRLPLVNNIPGAVSPEANIQNPAANDPQAVERGMKYFNAFNCVGCHAANGGGGMGPSLSDASTFKFPTNPGSLFLVITHGAPTGMPAWGTVLPQTAIWDMVAYIESISKSPRPAWGNTVSAAEHAPGIQQVPAEFKQTASPWSFTEPFTNGKQPAGEPQPPATTGSR
jgi:cytochrome c oxidase cbb3-type subunit 3